MHLSLKGSLKSSLVFTYVKTDQALDLGNLEPFTIPDLSGNANTATLYSGIYVSTNGAIDKAIGADATALGSGNYYLTGKIKPAGTTAKTTMDGSTASNLTGLTAGVWQDFQTATASAITPSSINLGWDGTAFNATVDNWSDVKLHDASDDSVVAHYKLYDSADASLDGYSALDCVGGYHGAHVGCAGGSGEGVDADVAGISATLDDKMLFGGVDDYVAVSGMAATTNYFGACTIEATIYVTDLTSNQAVFALGSACYRLFISSSGTFGLNTTDTLVPAVMGVQTVAVDFNASGLATALRVNGVTEWTGTAAVGTATNTFYIGTRNSGGLGLFYKGLVYDFSLSGSSVKNFAFTGDELVTWTDTTGNGNNGTVNGNPVTVGQKRETILQTAGEDFNKRMWFDGAGDYLSRSAGSDYNLFGNTIRVETTVFVNNFDAPRSFYSRGGATLGYAFSLNSSGQVIVGLKQLAAANHFVVTSTDALLLGVNTIDVQVDYTGADPVVSVSINGVASTLTINTPKTGSYAESSVNASIGSRENGNGLFFEGLIYNLTAYKNGVAIVTDQSAGWTANGSPSLYHVAESETTAGQDALGTAIVNPRPNERVLNLTTGTGYAEVADNDSLDLGTSSLVTHEFWIKIEDGSVNHRIIDKASSVNGIGLQYISSISSIRVTFRTQSNSTSTWDGATDIADGQWHHIIVRLNNRQTTPVAGDVSILIDGADDSATLFNSASNLTATLTNAEPLHIGFNDDFPTQKLVGQIGDVRQYDRALTADEVLKNYNARKGAYGL
jgi:hypothetical protein